MPMYGHSLLKESATTDDLRDINLQPYVELMAYDDISRDSAENIKEFCAGPVAAVLLEKQVLNKPSMMRLSKADDEKRRVKLIVYQLAKEANDPDWNKMVLHREKMKEHRAKLIQKYGNKAKRIAKEAQKQYIKNAKKAAAPEGTQSTAPGK